MDKSLPCSYEVEMQNFSMIKNKMEIYKSAVFEAEGYQWQLVVHPNGNKRKNVKDYISVYLAMVERVDFGWEVNAVFQLYLKNQHEFPEYEKSRFHPLKLENGFDEFMDLTKLNQHLEKEKDSFILVATVVCVQKQQTYGRAERLSMLDDEAPIGSHTWKIHKNVQESLSSQVFGDGTVEWKIQLYPKENGCLSIHLALANATSFSSSHRIYANVKLSILDEAKCMHTPFKDNLWFGSSRLEEELLTLDAFDKSRKCFPVMEMLFGESDVLVVEAEVKVVGTADSIP